VQDVAHNPAKEQRGKNLGNNLKRQMDETRILREQTAELLSDISNMMQLLTYSIENLRGDVQVRTWEARSLSVLGNNPQTRRLRDWLFTGTKERKAS